MEQSATLRRGRYLTNDKQHVVYIHGMKADLVRGVIWLGSWVNGPMIHYRSDGAVCQDDPKCCEGNGLNLITFVPHSKVGVLWV